MNDTVTDPIAHGAYAPNVPELIAEFQRCSPAAGSGWDRSTNNDDVRFNRWAGKTGDGRKHGTPDKAAFPFENASDAEIFLADDLVNSLTAIEFEAFWRAWMLPKHGLSEESQYAVKLADYFVNDLLFDQLFKSVELSSQYRNHYGWMGLQPTWVQEISLEPKEITLDDIAALAYARNDETALLPETIIDPTMDDESVRLLQMVYAEYTQQLMERVQTFQPKALRPATARRAIKDLRETGKTTIPVPAICRDEPAILPRKPWSELFITSDNADINQRRLYLRIFHDEVELKSRELTQGWSPAWVAEVLKTKGKQSVWCDGDTATNPPQYLSEARDGNTGNAWQTLDRKTGLMEVLYCLYRALDEDGIPGVYMTVVSPHIGKEKSGEQKAETNYGWHGLVAGARGKIPMVIGTRENVSCNFTSSRGVPEIAKTHQRQKKTQHDGLVDWLSVSVFPPIFRYASSYDTKFRFGPGVVNTIKGPNDMPKTFDVPGKGVPWSMEMIQALSNEAKDYFGLRTKEFPNGDPAKLQIKVGSFLLTWTSAIAELLSLAQVHMADSEFARVTGAPEGWLETRRKQYGLLGARLMFDVRELNPEYALKQLDIMNKTVLPGDVTGAIPRDKWTQIQLRTVSPLWAKALHQDANGASEKLYEGVRSDIESMFLGSEVKYSQNDPQASLKLKYATQIVQGNPHFMQAMQQEETRFNQLMMKYVKSLQFSITEEQNKKVGAIGVKPDNMQSQSV